jgi:argininosuccinate synthase
MYLKTIIKIGPPKDMWKLTADPEDAPNTPERIVIFIMITSPSILKMVFQFL